MSSTPLISIIVPAYNYGHFIHQALESIQAQTRQDWEVIVVDDGSTDNTREVVGGYAEKDNRIKYFCQKSGGPGISRNTGIRMSTGKYIQFLDADDMIEAEKLERQSTYLEQHREVDIVYGSVRYFKTENIEERLYSMDGDDKPWMREVSGAGKDVLMELTRSNIMVVNAPLIRRPVIDAIGLFDGATKGVEDWDYWIRSAAQGKRFQYYEPKGTLALVRYHPSSLSRNGLLMYRTTLLVRQKLVKLTNDPDVLKLNRERSAEIEGLLGVEEVLHGSRFSGSRRILKAAMMDRRTNQRMKWFICAAISPFVSKQRFKSIVASSVTHSVLGTLRKMRPTSN